MIKSKIGSSVFVLFLLFCICCCHNKKRDTNTDMTFDLVVVATNYYSDSLMQEKMGYPFERQLVLSYSVVNRSDSDFYIPLHCIGDDYKSHLNVTYKGKSIEDYWVAMGDRVVKAQDSTGILISFYFPSFENAGIEKEIWPEEIVKNLRVEYVIDNSDTVFSNLPIKEIHFNNNTTPRYFYKDSDDDDGHGGHYLILDGGYDKNEIVLCP